MRIRSAALVAATVLASVGGLAAPASAHEEINPKTFATGQPTFFTLTAANEEKADLVKIVLHAPAGVAFGETTRSPAGWTVNRTDDIVTWTGGAVKPDTFDNWGFEIEGADQPGTLAYKVTLAFADGKTDDVEVDVTAAAPGAGGTGGATPTSSSATVTTGAAAPSTAQSGSTNAGGSGSGKSDGTAKAALAVAIVALLLAAGALAAGARQRSPRPPADGGGAAGAAQDW